MLKIHLNQMTSNEKDEYELDPSEKYVINMDEELEFQTAIMMAIEVMGAPPALKNYHALLSKNHFNPDSPNPTNDFVAPYYGATPLWRTEYSQGIVVKAENDDDYYIVMECSKKNKGYKNTKIILTMGLSVKVAPESFWRNPKSF